MELFPPFKSFSAERQPDGSIRLVELVEKQVPLVKPFRVKGKLRWPQGLRPSRATTAAAVRADRDSR
jgi:hypothetical protein